MDCDILPERETHTFALSAARKLSEGEDKSRRISASPQRRANETVENLNDNLDDAC